MSKRLKFDSISILYRRIIDGSCNPSNVHLGDTVLFERNGIYEGKVHLITLRGLGIYGTDGHKFVKWQNVIEVKKTSAAEA